MTIEDFISFYRKPFISLKFEGVKFVKLDRNNNNRLYYQLIGKFSCIPREKDYNKLLQISDSDKNMFLKSFVNIETPSRIFRRKYKYYKEINNQKNHWIFNYIFDFTLSNIIDFEVRENKLFLYVYGFGIFG